MTESPETLGVEDYYRSFSAGTTIYLAGAPATDLILIRSGRVRLLKRSHGVERTVGWFGSEELIGEEALLPRVHRTGTAQAIETVTALVIARDTFRALVRERPDIGERVMHQLTRRLIRAEEQIENALLEDPAARVVNSLLRALDGHAELSIDLSPLELSTRTALELETVKAIVGQLRDRGYLDAGDQKITLIEPEALRGLQDLLTVKDDVRHGLI